MTIFSAVRHDLGYAFRMLRARPGFTAVAVVTLALGIGANTAIFSVVRSAAPRAAALSRSDRLYMLWEADASNPSRTTILSMPNYVDFQHGVTSFEQTAIWEDLFFNFSGDGEAERVRGLRVSASAFRMLGVAPQLGRTFTPDEDTPGHNVALISDALWQSRFGSRPDIVGQVDAHQRRAVPDRRGDAPGLPFRQP